MRNILHKRNRFDFNDYALTAFRGYAEEYKRKHPNFIEDIDQLNQIAELIADGRPEEAYQTMRRLDTFVRDGVPNGVYNYCQGCSELLSC